MSYTEGRLEVVTDCPGECCWHIQEVGNTDEFHRITTVEVGEEVARRLVACWNEHDALVKERDELVALLYDLLSVVDVDPELAQYPAAKATRELLAEKYPEAS